MVMEMSRHQRNRRASVSGTAAHLLLSGSILLAFAVLVPACDPAEADSDMGSARDALGGGGGAGWLLADFGQSTAVTSTGAVDLDVAADQCAGFETRLKLGKFGSQTRVFDTDEVEYFGSSSSCSDLYQYTAILGDDETVFDELGIEPDSHTTAAIAAGYTVDSVFIETYISSSHRCSAPTQDADTIIWAAMHKGGHSQWWGTYWSGPHDLEVWAVGCGGAPPPPEEAG